MPRTRQTDLAGLTIVLLLLSTLLTIPPARAAENNRYFPETKHTVSGTFLDYWTKNGGLPVYGYPITEAQNEVDPETGKTFLTQWFERNRFELHPENAGTNYEVLLGLLGKDLKREALRLDPDFQRAAALADPDAAKDSQWYFEETGHNLRFRFLDYWLKNGGLGRFGYPISEEYREVEPVTGKVYLVQWFERARFEYHPENNPPYQVLLGLLGTQLKQPGNRLDFLWGTGPSYSTAGRIAGISIDSHGTIYLPDTATGHLYKVSQEGQLLTWWDKAMAGEPASYDNIPLVGINNVTFDSQGNVYTTYMDKRQPGVRKYDKSGNLLLSFGDRGGGKGQFYSPRAIAVDGQGNIYVGDSYFSDDIGPRIQKFDNTGKFLLSFGDTVQDKKYESKLKTINSFTLDPQGNLYVLDLYGVDRVAQNIIKKYDGNGNYLGSWGKAVQLKSSSDADLPGDGEFAYTASFIMFGPMGLTSDAQGNIYVTDPVLNRVQKFDGNGNFLAKYVSTKKAKDSSSAATVFMAVAIDPQNNLFVLDLNDYNLTSFSIHQFKPDGQFVNEFSVAGMSSNAAGYSNPVFDFEGNLYLDSLTGQGTRISKISPTGIILYQIEVVPPKTYSLSKIIDREGNLFLYSRNYIKKFNPAGQVQPFELPASINLDKDPGYVSIDFSGNFYISEGGRVSKYDPGGKLVGTFATDWPGDSRPYWVIDRQDNFYLYRKVTSGKTDPGYFLMKKYNPGGELVATIDGRTAPVGALQEPLSLRYDDQGNIYMLESSINGASYPPHLDKFSPTGVFQYRLEFPMDKAGNLDIYNPGASSSSMTVDGNGKIYLLWPGDTTIDRPARLERYGTDGRFEFKVEVVPGNYKGQFSATRITADRLGDLYFFGNQIQKFRVR